MITEKIGLFEKYLDSVDMNSTIISYQRSKPLPLSLLGLQYQ